MYKILFVAKYTLIEQIRNRMLHVIFLFGAVFLYASVLLGILAVEQEVRVLLNLGLALIEFLGVCVAVFGAVVLVSKEMETKTIYLLLTRPLGRPSYIVGRYLGLLAAVWINLLAMVCLHLPLLILRGWEFQPVYLALIFLSGMKIVVIAALAVAFSLFSTSTVSSISITSIFWVMGHFWQDIKFLSEKGGKNLSYILLTLMGLLTPNLELFNLKDAWGAPQVFVLPVLLWVVPYSGLYACGCLMIASLLFSKKEF